jgi:phage RecT family recombinase
MNDQAKTNPQAPVSWEKFRTWLESQRVAEILARTLPPGVQVDAWVQASQVAIRSDPDLLRCSSESLAGAVLTVASLGLRLEGPLGQAYLSAREIRRKDKDSGDWYTAGYEAEMGVGYRGLIDLCYRDPEVRDVEAVIVYEGDDLDHASGSEPFLRHSWKPGAARVVPVAVFSGVRYRDRYYSFRVYPIADVMEVRRLALANQRVRIEVTEDGRELFFKSKGYGSKAKEEPLSGSDLDRIPWVAHLPAMIQKTAIRWSAKYWRANPALLQAAALAGLADSGTPQDLGAAARAMPAAVLAELVGPQAAHPNVQASGRATAAGAMATAGRVASLRPAAPPPATEPKPVEPPHEPEPVEPHQDAQETPQAGPAPAPEQADPLPLPKASEALAALRAIATDDQIREWLGGPIDGCPEEILVDLALDKCQQVTPPPSPKPAPHRGGRRGQG